MNSECETGDASFQRVHAQLRRAEALFAERFKRKPTMAACAPGRVNLIGEHTDYNMGFVLPIAIERETIIVADRAIDPDQSTLVAADLNETVRRDITSPTLAKQGGFADYLLGVAQQFHMRGMAMSNLDVLATSSVPIGAGLSSSAALEVAFATLLAQTSRAALPPLDVARLCRQAEHEFAGTPCGIMDMYVSAAARAGHAMLIDCRTETARHVPAVFHALESALLVIDTGVRNQLASSAYAERQLTCQAAAHMLGLPSLRDATIESLNMHGLTDQQRRRALHVIAENTRTVLAAEALALGNLRRMGDLMFQSHASLRDLFEVSCPELDAIVEVARAMRDHDDGVFGARMTGGGFGGCAIVVCEAASLESVEHRLESEFARRFSRLPDAMFTTLAANGARPLFCAD